MRKKMDEKMISMFIFIFSACLMILCAISIIIEYPIGMICSALGLFLTFKLQERIDRVIRKCEKDEI